MTQKRTDQKLGIEVQDFRDGGKTVQKFHFDNHKDFLKKLKSIVNGLGPGDVIRERTYTKLKIDNRTQKNLFQD